jgi:hypothetical protein
LRHKRGCNVSKTSICCLNLALACGVSGQVDRARLAGTVADATGAVLVGAKVEVVSQETGLRREVETGANGSYTISQLPIGIYTVTVTQAGFRTVAFKDVRLNVGDNRTLDVEMER